MLEQLNVILFCNCFKELVAQLGAIIDVWNVEVGELELAFESSFIEHRISYVSFILPNSKLFPANNLVAHFMYQV